MLFRSFKLSDVDDAFKSDRDDGQSSDEKDEVDSILDSIDCLESGWDCGGLRCKLGGVGINRDERWANDRSSESKFSVSWATSSTRANDGDSLPDGSNSFWVAMGGGGGAVSPSRLSSYINRLISIFFG